MDDQVSQVSETKATRENDPISFDLKEEFDNPVKTDDNPPSTESNNENSMKESSPGEHNDEELEIVSNSSPNELSDVWKYGKRIQFFRNGDRYFKGTSWAVSPQCYQQFASSLVNLVNGVNDSKFTDDQLNDRFRFNKCSIVASSTETDGIIRSHPVLTRKCFFSENLPSSETGSNLSIKLSLVATTQREKSGNVNETLHYGFPLEGTREANIPTLKTIVVIRNGVKPRRIVRFLLDLKYICSFEQAVNEMSDAVRAEIGTLKKVYDIEGNQCQSLVDLMKEDASVFIVYGPENPNEKDFELDPVERKWMSQKSKQMFHISSIATSRIKAVSKGISRELDLCGGQSKGEVSFIEEASDISFISIPGSTTSVEFWKHFDLGDIISKGRHSTLHRCTRKEVAEGQSMVVRIFEMKHFSESMLQELQIIRNIHHENLVQIVEPVYTSMEAIFVLFPSIMGLRLRETISSLETYTEQIVANFANDLLEAVKYLHQEMKMIHFNINEGSILVTFFSCKCSLICLISYFIGHS